MNKGIEKLEFFSETNHKLYKILYRILNLI